MRMTMVRVLVVDLVMLLSGQAVHASAGKTLMDDFISTFSGTWQTTTTLEENIPGQGEKGEEVVFAGTNSPILRNNAMACDWKVGSVRGKALGVLDRDENCVVVHLADSIGMVGRIAYTKKDGKWHATFSFRSADGSEESSKAVLTISDDGDTHTWAYTQRKKNGEELPDTTEVWHREKKS